MINVCESIASYFQVCCSGVGISGFQAPRFDRGLNADTSEGQLEEGLYSRRSQSAGAPRIRFLVTPLIISILKTLSSVVDNC